MRILERISYKKGKRGHLLEKKIEIVEVKAKCNTCQGNLMCELIPHPLHLDPGCAIFVRDFFRWSVFGIMTKLMGSPKTHGVTGHVGIREF